MKTHTKLLITALALGASTWITAAQDNDAVSSEGDRPPRHEGVAPGGPGGFHGQRPPGLPVLAALDANHDGVIDKDEIANASAALTKLDKDGNGKLTIDEIRPPRPEGSGRPDGQGRGPGGPPQSDAAERPPRPAPEQ